MAGRGYRVLPPNASPREIADVVNSLRGGKINAVGNVALGTGATTVISDFYAHSSAVPVWSPRNQAAAQDAIWLQSLGDQTFTLGHPTSTASRLIRYAVLG